MPKANTKPSSSPPASSDEVPRPQYLDASRVVSSMAVFGRGRVAELSTPRIVVLAVLAGGFITVGALFVAAGFQHSPANMGYIALHIAHGGDLDWATALGWNIIPAGIGNMLSAATLVAIPYWYVFRRRLGSNQQAPQA